MTAIEQGPATEEPSRFIRVLRAVWGHAWPHRVGVIGLAASVLAAIFAPLLTPYDPIALDLTATLSPPSLAHPFGTDQLGRDILTRKSAKSTMYRFKVDLIRLWIDETLPSL